MKKIVKFAMVMVVAAVVAACTKPDNNGLVFLDVTPNNISGVWRMDSYDNGVKLPEGCYYYIVFDRAERTFVTYDNLGSMEAYKNSGRYDIVTDGAAVIRGIYDYGRGDWEHEYYVRNLTSDSMVWVATDDESVKQVYVRASLPEELANDEE
ncbi:MAG: lipocalin family protein [Alistipes sp.]|nr:lipocalin family protein [Alistipes sp.]MBQ3026841.1 lipocalin family protein [Alistipes sp.]